MPTMMLPWYSTGSPQFMVGVGVPLPSVHCKPKIAVNWNIIIMMGINSAYGTISAIKPGYGAVKPLTALKNQVNGAVSQVP